MAMIRVHSLELPDLERFLERHKAGFTLRSEVGLDQLLRQILEKAYEFVPSQSGSILLDDPLRKVPSREQNELTFIATFGEASERLVGTSIPASQGIVGRVYQAGQPHLSADVRADSWFFAAIDQKLGHQSNTIVCVPIYIGSQVCGVLELINRSDGQSFTERDMRLLEIFAGYTSFSLQNALDARRAHELAKRDDLTGLYNDRWFHVRLHEILVEAEQRKESCAVLFIDLDHFKEINDQYGHLAGSQVLREVGFLLKRTVDNEQAVVSRYGGDEFVMILPDSSIDEAVELAGRVREAISDHVFLARDYGFGTPALGLRGALSASIGIASHVPGREGALLDLDKRLLLKRADTAMYEAKAKGKNRIEVSVLPPPKADVATG